MAWNRTLTNLRDVLADLYFTVDESRRVLEEAGLKPAWFPFDNKAITNWHGILREADKRGKVQAIIDVAAAEYPENTWIQEAKNGSLDVARGADIAKEVQWSGPEDTTPFEKITGAQSTLLPISFLETGLRKAKAVVRIVLPDGACGTGFLAKDNLIITNNHVIGSADVARTAKVQFNYEKNADNLDLKFEEFSLDPSAGFATSPKEKDDWTAIRLKEGDYSAWGFLPLQRTTIKKDDPVNIIQHPAGGSKQIALYHNLVAFADDTRVQYLTDTMPGSSGSPVFDSDWRIVALHHSGGWLREPNSKQQFFRNEGIAINVVIDGLKGAGLIKDG